MNADFSSLIDSFAGLHVLVIGEAMLDTYLDLSQAKPPVVGRDISGETRNPSGFSGSKRVLSFL